MIPIPEGLSLLEELITSGARPGEAIARVAALRHRHGDAAVELRWSEAPETGAYSYDLVLDLPERAPLAATGAVDRAGAIEVVVGEARVDPRLLERLVGAEARAVYDADPTRFDALELVALPVAADDAAAIAAALAAGGDLEAAARHARRRRRAVLFTTVLRDELAPADLAAGAIAVARLRGAGPYVVRVERVAPRRFDDVADAIARRLFDAWLAARRREARIARRRSPRGTPRHRA